ncbi:MAG TPA: hypothetical protein VG367_03435 [Mucilaginibacter sp.]|jgi:hypothetical protein|nr:hypothetical protein [Mucilaginibacter sp.]
MSSFAGFLDGYKSRNIASIETGLQYKLNEIIDLIGGLLNDFSNGTYNKPEMQYFLQRSLILLRERNGYNIIGLLTSFGESLKGNMSLINSVATTDSLLKEKLRKVLYNFADLASLSEDNSLINLAIDISERFVY